MTIPFTASQFLGKQNDRVLSDLIQHAIGTGRMNSVSDLWVNDAFSTERISMLLFGGGVYEWVDENPSYPLNALQKYAQRRSLRATDVLARLLSDPSGSPTLTTVERLPGDLLLWVFKQELASNATFVVRARGM